MFSLYCDKNLNSISDVMCISPQRETSRNNLSRARLEKLAHGMKATADTRKLQSKEARPEGGADRKTC